MTITQFVKYVRTFYGPHGVYPMGATAIQIRRSIKVLMERYGDVQFDSLDRERVRDILIERFGLAWKS